MQNSLSSQRVQIAIMGKRNAGKSSLINMLSGQDTAIVSETPGTTTDPVRKSIEIHGLGPCILIDTAGLDDEGALGAMRAEKSKQMLSRAELVILVADGQESDFSLEKEWVKLFKSYGLPVLLVVNKSDRLPAGREEQASRALEMDAILVSTLTLDGKDALFTAIRRAVAISNNIALTAHWAKPGDRVVLLMPQDDEAPKGRLILPQVRVIRDLLDMGALPICATEETYLEAISLEPDLIIADSKVFALAYQHKPENTVLTSFSIVMAREKGEIDAFVQGARHIANLKDGDNILIAEACTHNAQDGDIGRVKIPALIRKHANVNVDVVSGNDFPDDLSGYALIVHCGGCMINRRFMMNRIRKSQEQGVPITNYGVAIAYLTGILDRVSL